MNNISSLSKQYLLSKNVLDRGSMANFIVHYYTEPLNPEY
jgi:hypothetical protein